MVLKIDRTAARKRIDNAEQVPIFELDGTIYTVPRVTRSELQLRYLDIAHAEGSEAANYFLLTEMFGQDGFEALKSVDGLSDEDFQGVIDQVTAVVMPAANPKGRAA